MDHKSEKKQQLSDELKMQLDVVMSMENYFWIKNENANIQL